MPGWISKDRSGGAAGGGGGAAVAVPAGAVAVPVLAALLVAVVSPEVLGFAVVLLSPEVTGFVGGLVAVVDDEEDEVLTPDCAKVAEPADDVSAKAAAETSAAVTTAMLRIDAI